MRVLFGLILLLLTTKAISDTKPLIIAFEPFPPFITQDKDGLTVDMLRAIEQHSSLRFDIRLMTYARAKHELKHGRIDIAGHTPKNLETAAFYEYALELDWQIQTTSDLFAFDEKFLNIDHIKRKRIGTTSGNADFFAQQLGVEPDIFVEVRTLHQLVDMFIKGRIDVLLFERASVMTLLAEKGVYGIHYQSIGLIPASMAVFKDQSGVALKKQLDGVIKTLDLDAIFSGYLQYIHLPSKGVTSKLHENH
ncbi:substrate-binding periplasmic protein [Thalassotalea sediminis]|uniref:substrate-binding periplasmic protein n=1 Tax=Thalassotalea sediminis TaxID=1759089 RepID=UPI002572D162|nr:transporter substrate-binding domain-containing protein [Thalassotalea sediminis]